MKRALVLAGGGSKGAYEAGFVKALHELGIDYQIVTGTSIGALNGCLIAQQDLDALFHLWDVMDINTVFAGEFPKDGEIDLDTMLNQSHLVVSFFKKYMKEKGADITPLKHLIKGLLKTDQLLQSPIDFGLCTVHYPSLKPLFITKEEMEKESIFDYLISSASCFPVFPIHTFNNQSFIDGGYYDNLPIDLALDMGADEVIVVDMKTEPTHPYYYQRPYFTYTMPYLDLGGFMDFSRKSLERNQRIGYQTAMKYFGGYLGSKYTFKKFETPLFHDYYQDVLYYERRMRRILRNDTSRLYDLFLESHRQIPLDEKDYLYIVLDWIAELVERDPTYVYDFELLSQDLLEDFDQYIQSTFQTKMFQFSTDNLKNLLKDVNKKGLVGRLLHQMLYPHDNQIDIDTALTIFPKEVMMARFLFMLYHLKTL